MKEKEKERESTRKREELIYEAEDRHKGQERNMQEWQSQKKNERMNWRIFFNHKVRNKIYK